MFEKTVVKKNEYYDSVTLMTLTNKIKKLPGVSDAVISMATPMNLELLQSVGLSNAEAEAASPNDLLIAIRTEDEEHYHEAYGQADTLLGKSGEVADSGKQAVYHTISQAKREHPEYNVAVISVAGQYAAREARQALKNGMHVMLFSDNVSIEEELELKQEAHRQELLVMGPDCGTAILDGVGLCFANQVRRGNIGLVAASGTGLQEVTVLIDRLGGGVSQAIGSGGRDLSAEIGGIMMLDGLRLLEQDKETQVIVLISKPPVKEVAHKILQEVENCKKPVVICFIGAASESEDGNSVYAANLEDAAAKAVRLAKGEALQHHQTSIYPLPEVQIKAATAAFAPEQRYIRGLFCGGTLAAEALNTIAKHSLEVYSNVAKRPEQKIADPQTSVKHTIIDLGDDVFTQGRPHPMIEPEIRNERLIREASDPQTAVVLLDFELGFGSHDDPAGVTVEAIRSAKELAEGAGRRPAFVAYILGTDQDFQGYEQQKQLLEDAGVLVAKSNLNAVEIALAMVLERG